MLWFRFQLLKSYGSGSYFLKIMVPVPAPYLDHKKQNFQKNVRNFFDFILRRLLYKEFFVINFNKFMAKCG